MRRFLLLPVLTAVLVAACSAGPATAPTTTADATTSTSSAAASTTTSLSPDTTVDQPTSTTTPPEDQVGVPTSLGDSRYPDLGNTGYDVDAYTIELSFDPTDASIDAVTTIDAVATEDLDTFSLDFIGYDISEVTVDQAAAAHSRTDTKLVVAPATSIPNGEAFSVTVAYAGTPRPFTTEAMWFQMGWRSGPRGEQYVVAEPDASRTWFPCNDHPIDKATYTFHITTPDNLLGVSNGNLVDTVEADGTVTRVYDVVQPMSTYLATVVIGDLRVIHDEAGTDRSGVQIRNVVPPAMSAEPPLHLDLQGEMMEFFVDLFGPYPFDLYGIAVVPDFPAALENTTLSIFGEDIVRSIGFFEAVLVHELAHQWFGNSVTMADWGDLWLNEGFATYAEWLWTEERQGRDAMDAQIADVHTDMQGAGWPPPGSPPADDLFNPSVYFTGGLTLHALRLEVGDVAFFEILRTYLNEFSFGLATTEDFIDVAETISGVDLDDLFEAWLYGDDVPDLEL